MFGYGWGKRETAVGIHDAGINPLVAGGDPGPVFRTAADPMVIKEIQDDFHR